MDDAHPPSGIRVLVVEDEPALRGALCAALRHAGFEVTAAGDGLEGLREALSGRHRAVLLDLGLPGLDGLGVLERLRGERSAPPVVVCTNSDRESDRDRAAALGAAGYLVKAATPLREIVAAVRDVLR